MNQGILIEGAVRVEWTVAPIVYVGALPPKFFGHPAVERLYRSFVVESAGYTSLVGNDENVITKIVRKPDRLLGSINPPETISGPDVIIVIVQHPIAIEKYGRSAALRRDCSLR